MIGRMLTFTLIYLLLFNVIADFYFYRYFICRVTTSRWIRRLHWIADLLFAVTMVVLFTVDSRERMISHEVYQTFMYVYLLVYLPKLVYMVCSLPAFLSRNRTFKNVFYWFGGIVGLTVFLGLLYGNLIGRNSVRVSEATVYASDLPPAFEGYRIVQLSDTHVGNMRNPRLLEKVLKKTEALDPDLIVFSGDLVHSRSNELPRYKDVLSRFHARDGIYAVLGNHDYGDYTRWPNREAYRANRQALENFYREIGWHLLNNASAIIRHGGDSIAVIGVENWGNPPFPQYADLETALKGTETVDYKILISHDPDHWSQQVKGKEDIGLTLSGHTHGMQLAVRIGDKRYSPAAWKYELWGGLYREGEQYIYVNEGIGTVLFPFRLGATPEITLITLKRKP